MKTTLIIMAAGIGSRFGTGIKQLTKMGLNDEIIMDYSIHDAKEAGFDKVIIIIRKDIEEEFKQVIGNRIGKYMDVEYVFQSIDDLPEGFSVPEGRTKPWGTGQAILCCKDVVKDPFVVINADDYYGKEAFKLLHDFLVKPHSASDKFNIGMAGFILKNTLNKNGTVTRGICITDENDMLLRVQETKGIGYTEDGKLTCVQEEVMPILNEEAVVSMNMWAAYPEFLDYLEKDFVNFLTKNGESKTSEYLLPMIVDELLQKGKVTVNVMRTNDKWIGITYAEDTELAKESFKDMIEKGIYNADLWEKYIKKENMEIYYYKGGKNIIENFNKNERINKINELIKENLKVSNLCFLLGSGCSIGAIPLMGKTFENIKNNLNSSEKKILLKKYSTSNDIEGCLNWLNKGIEFFSSEDETRKKYLEIFNLIKDQLINSIQINYTEEKACNTLKLYINFFNKIFEERVYSTSNPVNIFTTNYDLFNEKALENLKIEYANGFSGYIDRIFSPYSFNYRIVDEENRYKDKWVPIKKYIRLYKIHGSIDWIYKDNKILQSREAKEEKVLIYPLQTKHYDTQQSPYSELFREMNIKLQEKNTTLIVIGYGFPDDHINNLISQALVNADFNLIVFSNLQEENVKNFFEKHKEKNNFHFIGGNLEKNEKIHYFNNIIKILDNNYL